MNTRKFFGWLAVLFVVSMIAGIASALPFEVVPETVYMLQNDLLGLQNQRSAWLERADGDPRKASQLKALGDKIRVQEALIVSIHKQVLAGLSESEREVILQLPVADQMGSVDLLNRHEPHERAQVLGRLQAREVNPRCAAWTMFH